LQFGKPGAANDSARQHMASAMPDLVAETEEPRSAADPAPEEVAEAPANEPVAPRPPAEIVQLDRFRKK
jgi:hypothetical protein